MAARPIKSYGKKKYNFKDSRFKLQPDMKGFLCTCNYGEKDCQKEAINLLREYSEENDVSLYNCVHFTLICLITIIIIYKNLSKNYQKRKVT